MNKKYNYTKEEREKARTFFSRYYGLGFEGVSRERLEEMVGVFYQRVHGHELEELSRGELFNIARKLYKISGDVVRKFGRDEFEESVLRNIGAYKRSKNTLAREKLDERICIQIEGLPDEHRLVREYYFMKKKDQLDEFLENVSGRE